MRTHLAALGIAAVTLAACSDGDAPQRPPTQDYGLAGLSCGDVVVPLVSNGQVPQAVVDCLLAALETGREAHVVVTTTTIEGDPLFTAFQSVGKGKVATVYDARWDQFGSDRLSRQRCSTAPSGGQQALAGDGGRSLFVTDCRRVG